MNGVAICRNGAAGADRSLVDLSPRQVLISVDLHAGDSGAVLWTNDLSHAYVEENSAYST
jgi:glutamate N-acetyltransferase/amino-acid N-acetyltransferase